MLKSREKAVQRLTELPKQQGGLPFDYLEPETDWEARQCPRSKGRKACLGLSEATWTLDSY